MAKWVYTFGDGKAEGDAGQRDLLGGKGANLAEMSSLGLPVPPGMTITTEVCTYYYENGETYPPELVQQVDDALAVIAASTGRRFGDAEMPLLVSVRSGARISMPGMMDTVLNLGLNDETVKGLAETSGDARFAWDSYRRFIQMYSDVVLGLDHGLFEEALEIMREDNGFFSDTEMQAEHWEKLVGEYREILDQIEGYLEILGSTARLMEVIREELTAIREAYGDERRTVILEDFIGLDLEDLITPQDVVVTLSHTGYVKSQPLDVFQAQKRGGRGKMASSFKSDDFIDALWVTHTHDTLLCFSSAGKVYWLKVYQIPQGSRGSRGKPIVNLLPLEGDERISAVLPIKDFSTGESVFFVTRQGVVKKTELDAFSRPRSSGIIALALRADDALVGAALTDGARDILLVADNGPSWVFGPAGRLKPGFGQSALGLRGRHR